MPIRGMTGRGPSLRQLGTLRKGAKKTSANRPGEDLEHFRLVCDDPSVVADFERAYGKEPQVIHVLFPHKELENNWSAWCEEYVAGGLVHRCDGEILVQWKAPKGKSGYETDYEQHHERACPYFSGEKERTSDRPGCKQVGRMRVLIPALDRLAYVLVLTSSKNDIPNLDSQLWGIWEQGGQDMRNIPCLLQRSKENISTPQMKKQGNRYVPTGDRARRDSWLLSVEVMPGWVPMRQPQLPGRRMAGYIPAPNSDWEEGEYEDIDDDGALAPTVADFGPDAEPGPEPVKQEKAPKKKAKKADKKAKEKDPAEVEDAPVPRSPKEFLALCNGSMGLSLSTPAKAWEVMKEAHPDWKGWPDAKDTDGWISTIALAAKISPIQAVDEGSQDKPAEDPQETLFDLPDEEIDL